MFTRVLKVASIVQSASQIVTAGLSGMFRFAAHNPFTTLLLFSGSSVAALTRKPEFYDDNKFLAHVLSLPQPEELKNTNNYWVATIKKDSFQKLYDTVDFSTDMTFRQHLQQANYDDQANFLIKTALEQHNILTLRHWQNQGYYFDTIFAEPPTWSIFSVTANPAQPLSQFFATGCDPNYVHKNKQLLTYIIEEYPSIPAIKVALMAGASLDLQPGAVNTPMQAAIERLDTSIENGIAIINALFETIYLRNMNHHPHLQEDFSNLNNTLRSYSRIFRFSAIEEELNKYPALRSLTHGYRADTTDKRFRLLMLLSTLGVAISVAWLYFKTSPISQESKEEMKLTKTKRRKEKAHATVETREVAPAQSSVVANIDAVSGIPLNKLLDVTAAIEEELKTQPKEKTNEISSTFSSSISTSTSGTNQRKKVEKRRKKEEEEEKRQEKSTNAAKHKSEWQQSQKAHLLAAQPVAADPTTDKKFVLPKAPFGNQSLYVQAAFKHAQDFLTLRDANVSGAMVDIKHYALLYHLQRCYVALGEQIKNVKRITDIRHILVHLSSDLKLDAIATDTAIIEIMLSDLSRLNDRKFKPNKKIATLKSDLYEQGVEINQASPTCNEPGAATYKKYYTWITTKAIPAINYIMNLPHDRNDAIRKLEINALTLLITQCGEFARDIGKHSDPSDTRVTVIQKFAEVCRLTRNANNHESQDVSENHIWQCALNVRKLGLHVPTEFPTLAVRTVAPGETKEEEPSQIAIVAGQSNSLLSAGFFGKSVRKETTRTTTTLSQSATKKTFA